MQYGLTAQTIKRAKLKALPKGEETDWRFVWEVNYASICGKKTMLIVHVDTRYTMIYTDIKPNAWKNLQIFLHEAVEGALKREGFTNEEIAKYFRLAGEESITRTHGRKATGGMNHLTTILPYFAKPLLNCSFQPIITDFVNEDICSLAVHPEETYVMPKEYFVKRMRMILCDD